MSCWREKNIVQSSAAQSISDNPEVSHTLYAPAGDKQKNGRISGSHLTSQFSVVIRNIRDDVRKNTFVSFSFTAILPSSTTQKQI